MHPWAEEASFWNILALNCWTVERELILNKPDVDSQTYSSYNHLQIFLKFSRTAEFTEFMCELQVRPSLEVMSTHVKRRVHTRAHARTHTHTLSLSLSHTHTHTHTHTHALSLSLTHTHTHTHTLSLSLTHTHTHTLSRSHTHTHTLSLTHTHTHTHTLSLSLSLSHTHQPGFANLVSEQRLCVVNAAPCEITHMMEITADYRTGFTDKMRIKYCTRYIVQP